MTAAICEISGVASGARRKRTSPRYVFSSRPFTTRAEISLSAATSLLEIIGVLIVLEALMISLIRGTPRVTFIEATPAKWNVFKVIWVPGSPIDCAPTAPTVEPTCGSVQSQGLNGKWSTPGSILALTYFSQQMARKVLTCSSVTLDLLSTAAILSAKRCTIRLISRLSQRSTHWLHPWLSPYAHPIQCPSPRHRIAREYSGLSRLV